MSSKKHRKKLKQKYINTEPEPIKYTTNEQKVLDFFKEYPNVIITTSDVMELLEMEERTWAYRIIKSVQSKNPNITVKSGWGGGFKYVI